MSTAPTLTWEMTANTAVSPTNTTAAVLTAISTAIGNSSDWSVNASGAGYLELAPVVSSPVNSMRVLVAAGINSAQVQSPHNLNSNVVYIGIAPDGGTLGDPLGSSNPYGSARWSGYWKFSPAVTTNDIGTVFVTACKEVVGIWMKRASADTWYGALAGCIVDAPEDSDGEGTPGRVYGMMTTGSDGISTTFWQNASEFVGSNGTGNQDPVAGVFNPSNTTSWVRIRSIDMGVGEQQPRHTTQGGTRLTLPVLMYLRGTPYNTVGVLRQMRKAQDSTMRVKVQDGGSPPSDFSIHISARDSGSPVDTLSLDNG